MQATKYSLENPDPNCGTHNGCNCVLGEIDRLIVDNNNLRKQIEAIRVLVPKDRLAEYDYAQLTTAIAVAAPDAANAARDLANSFDDARKAATSITEISDGQAEGSAEPA